MTKEESDQIKELAGQLYNKVVEAKGQIILIYNYTDDPVEISSKIAGIDQILAAMFNTVYRADRKLNTITDVALSLSDRDVEYEINREANTE